MEILGYFIHKDDEYPLNAHNVMVVIDEGHKRLTCYCPIGQHSEMDRGYFKECISITKEEYIDTSRNFYTPTDYL